VRVYGGSPYLKRSIIHHKIHVDLCVRVGGLKYLNLQAISAAAASESPTQPHIHTHTRTRTHTHAHTCTRILRRSLPELQSQRSMLTGAGCRTTVTAITVQWRDDRHIAIDQVHTRHTSRVMLNSGSYRIMVVGRRSERTRAMGCVLLLVSCKHAMVSREPCTK